MTFTGRIALVTGGSRGIGRAIVERLVGEGSRVYFTCRTDPGVTGAVAIRTDHEDVGSVRSMFDAVGDRLDILVNSAAVNPGTPMDAVTAEEFDRVLTVNTKVPLLAMRGAAERMGRGGRIVNVSTLPARTATIRQLVLQAPPPVVAGMLGYHHETTTKLAADAGSPWSSYAPGDHTRPQPMIPKPRTPTR